MICIIQFIIIIFHFCVSDNPSYFSVSQQQRQCAQTIRDDASRLSSESPRRIKSDSNPITESVCYSDVVPGNQYLVPNGGKSPRTDPSRRSFRSLLRSFSANAACPQDAQSILGGEPRPSDIAPADHSSIFGARSHRRFVHSRNTSDVRHLVRKKSHESSDNDDVFFTMPLSSNSKRRHSLGAYFVRDKMAGTKNLLKVTTVPSEVPSVDAPKVLNDGSPVFSSPVRGTKKVHTITTLHCDDPPKPVNTPPTTSPQKKKKPKSQSKGKHQLYIFKHRTTSCLLSINKKDQQLPARFSNHFWIRCTLESCTSKNPQKPQIPELTLGLLYRNQRAGSGLCLVGNNSRLSRVGALRELADSNRPIFPLLRSASIVRRSHRD